MDYLLKAKQILAGCLSVPVDSISDDGQLEQLSPMIDSVVFANIMMEVENFVQKEIDVTEWLELGSVKDLAGILEKNHRQ